MGPHIMLGIVTKISSLQWLLIGFCITLVIALEMINTAIEALADHLHPGIHPKIGLVKDLAAGAVLIAAVMAFITGCCIFTPRILNWLGYH